MCCNFYLSLFLLFLGEQHLTITCLSDLWSHAHKAIRAPFWARENGSLHCPGWNRNLKRASENEKKKKTCDPAEVVLILARAYDVITLGKQYTWSCSSIKWVKNYDFGLHEIWHMSWIFSNWPVMPYLTKLGELCEFSWVRISHTEIFFFSGCSQRVYIIWDLINKVVYLIGIPIKFIPFL